MSSQVIKVKDLSVKIDGHTIVDNISFDVRDQEILAVIGPNGSGKSTLVKALLGLIPYQKGTISFDRESVGYVPQYLDFDRSFPLTVEEFLLLSLQDVGFWFRLKDTQELVQEALKTTGVQKLAQKLLGNLSGGELQRVMIANALINKPKVLILDEPLASIDIAGGDSIQNMIERLHEKYKLTIIMVSHDLDVVFRHASSVLCLNRQMVCHGTPSEVLTEKTLEKLYGQVKGFYHKHE